MVTVLHLMPAGSWRQAGTAIAPTSLLTEGFVHCTGDHATMLRSLAAKVLPLADDIVVLPGHGEQTSIGRERATNPFLQDLPRDLPHARWTLMTSADAEDPARHLYASEGWQVIGPGLRDEQVIMGRRPT